MTNSSKIHSVAIIGVFTALIAVSAFIRIPTPIMPFSMQIFMVILTPMLIGARNSFFAMLLYIALGLIGLPVFVSGGGPAYVLQPTFGFLIGFLISTIPNGIISRRGGKVWNYFTYALIAWVVVYIFGVGGFWLNMNCVQGKEMSLLTASKLVATPFIIPDMIKLVLISLIVVKLKSALRSFLPNV